MLESINELIKLSVSYSLWTWALNLLSSSTYVDDIVGLQFRFYNTLLSLNIYFRNNLGISLSHCGIFYNKSWNLLMQVAIKIQIWHYLTTVTFRNLAGILSVTFVTTKLSTLKIWKLTNMRVVVILLLTTSRILRKERWQCPGECPAVRIHPRKVSQ